jgi:hypothetical protein
VQREGLRRGDSRTNIVVYRGLGFSRQRPIRPGTPGDYRLSFDAPRGPVLPLPVRLGRPISVPYCVNATYTACQYAAVSSLGAVSMAARTMPSRPSYSSGQTFSINCAARSSGLGSPGG